MLYFTPRPVLEVLDELIKISGEKGLARPKEMSVAFSLPHRSGMTKIEGKLAPALEELKARVSETRAIAVATAIELRFDSWKLTFEMPVERAWWTAKLEGKEVDGAKFEPWLIAIAAALGAHPDKPVTEVARGGAGEALAAQIGAARRMEAVAATIAEELGKVAIERDRALSKKTEELEASVRAERERLAKERIEFEREKTERDAREATVVRRGLLAETLKALDAEPAVVLSEETTGKRRVIALVLVVAMILGVALIGVALYFEARPPERSEGLIVSRSLAATGVVLFASSLWYFVRWQDRWQATHAAAELQNRKNRKDMLRASWLAELIIEAGKEAKVSLPDRLLEGMAHGLFVAPSEAAVTEHPVEVLFKRAGLDRLEVGKAGIKLGKARPSKESPE